MRSLLSLCLIGVLVTESLATDDAAKFVEDVLPLLEAKCVSCHGSEKQEGGLRLDSLAAAKEGGESGPALVPGDLAKSLLVKAITFRDPNLQMPPKQKLSDKEIDTLTKWVKAGAAWPNSVPHALGTESPASGDAFTDKRNPIRKLFRGERLDLWSLKKPRSHARHRLLNLSRRFSESNTERMFRMCALLYTSRFKWSRVVAGSRRWAGRCGVGWENSR